MNKTSIASSPWQVLQEATVFSAPPFLSIARQRVLTDSGQEVPDYYQVKLPDFAIAVPLTDSGQIITLWQYKHGARHFGLTFPAGQIENGEDPERAMRRELLEETGYAAATARCLGRFAVSGNQGCGFANLFVFHGCRLRQASNAGDLETMELRLMTAAEIREAIAAGAVGVLPHIAVWGMAQPYLPDGAPSAG